MATVTVNMIGNAHLDPVPLRRRWDGVDAMSAAARSACDRIGMISWCLIVICCANCMSQEVRPRIRLATTREALHAQALEESAIPVRPGLPGHAPFWNEKSRRFIYAPAFDFKSVPGAAAYRFTVIQHDRKETFEAGVPWAPLTPVWKDLPVGMVSLRVEGVGAEDAVLAVTGERTFYRAAVFNGPYHDPVMDYEESARLALRRLLDKPFVRHWLTSDQPDPDYVPYRYPAKIVGAVIAASAAYVGLTPRPADANRVLTIGRRAADYLISLHLPEGYALEHCPLTYHGLSKSHMKDSRSMMLYPAEAGMAYLDLYDVTDDRQYLDAAKGIANSYVHLQLPEGTWYHFIDNKTGKQVAENLLIPTAVIRYLDRLGTQYRLKGYRKASERAVQWIRANTMKTFNWQAQFEDVRPGRPYANLSREQTCD